MYNKVRLRLGKKCSVVIKGDGDGPLFYFFFFFFYLISSWGVYNLTQNSQYWLLAKVLDKTQFAMLYKKQIE